MEKLLLERTAPLRSALFTHRVKERVTPAGRSFMAIRGSPLRGAGPFAQRPTTALWPTTTTTDAKSSGAMGYPTSASHHAGVTLTDAARMAAPWATPVSTEISNTLESYLAMEARMTSGPRTAITHPSIQAQLAEGGLPTDSGPTPSGSPVATEKRGQLNPAHSRFLMGLPAVWDCCGGTVTRLSRRKQRSSSAA